MNGSNCMKYSILLVTFCLMPTGCSANSSLRMAPDEGVQGPPTLVLWSIEASPNIDHSARVAVYPPGSVIYRQEDPVSGVPRYRQARLFSEQYAQLAGPTRLKLLAALEESYFVSDAIGALDNIIQWRTPENRVRQRTVTGFLDPGADIERGRTPSAFLSLYDALATFDPPNARAYVPETVEVILRSARSGDSAPWPPEWPAPLPSGVTDSESHGERLVAVFPGSRLGEVLKWVSEHHQAGRLVTYNGQLYVAYVRAVLPGNPRVLSAAEANAP